MPSATKTRVRRSAGRCVWCHRGVWPLGSILCERCTKRARRARQRYNRRNKDKRYGRWQGYWFDPANRREVYLEKKLAGLCVEQGCGEDAMEDSVRCPKHRASTNRRAREYQRRKAKSV